MTPPDCCLTCGHLLSKHGRPTGSSLSGCQLCRCDFAVAGAGGRAVRTTANTQGPLHVGSAGIFNLQSGDTLEVTERNEFGEVIRVSEVRVEAFDDLITRVEALTGLNARQASVIAAEVTYLDGDEPGSHPKPEHLIVAKAKELGYLPDNWRLA